MPILGDLLTRITSEIVNPLIVLVFLLAVAAFGWGIVMYLAAQGSDDKVQKGKKIMWWGIIGMFVLASMWGMVYLLCDFFGTCRRSGSFSGFPPGGVIVDPGGGNINPGDVIISPGDINPGGGTVLTPAEQAACSDRARCEPCAHFLDEGNPRAYVKCVKDILGF